MVVNEIVGRIRRFPELRQDHLLLALQVRLVEVRRANQVGNELGDERQVPRQRAAVEHSLIARGPGVERPADILDRLGERAGIAAAGSLEHHMFDEVRETAQPLRLRARAHAGVETERDRLRAGQRVDCHGQPVRKDMLLAAHLGGSLKRVRSASA